MLQSFIEMGVPEEYYMLEGVVYKYTFPDDMVYIGRTCREPEQCHYDHLHQNPLFPMRNFMIAYREQGEPRFEILETIKCASQEELIQKLNEREDFYIQQYQATNPQKGYNHKLSANISQEQRAKKIEELIESYTSMFLNSKYSLYQSVVRKLDDIRSMNEEERKFYNKYFGEENMYYGSDTRKEAANGFWREEYEDYALFMLEEEAKVLAEEYVHENESSLLSIFFKA